MSLRVVPLGFLMFLGRRERPHWEQMDLTVTSKSQKSVFKTIKRENEAKMKARSSDNLIFLKETYISTHITKLIFFKSGAINKI